MGKHKKSKSEASSEGESDNRSSKRESRSKRRSSSSSSSSSGSSSSDSSPDSRGSGKRNDEEKVLQDMNENKERKRNDSESSCSEGEIKNDHSGKRKRSADPSDDESKLNKRKRGSNDEKRERRQEYHRSDRAEGRRRERARSRSYEKQDEEPVRSYYQGDYYDEREEERRRRHRERDERERRNDRRYDRRRDDDRDRRRHHYEDDRRDRRHRRDEEEYSRSRRKRDKDSEEKEVKSTEPPNPLNEGPKAPTMGAYIPPAKLRMMQNAIEDKYSASYQRLAWEALKKSINGLINKVNVSNISLIVRDLFKENLIRGRGIFCRSVMQAQAASPTYTNVFAALVAIINTKFPNIGELLLKRLILQFRRGYKRNDKTSCLAAVKFMAHLVNQQVAHEVLALELLTLLLETPTSHSIEVAIAFLKEVGARLDEVLPRGAQAIFERLRHLLHEGKVEKRIQYMIEVMAQIKKDKYNKYPALLSELDLVEEEDQFTHLITLDEEIDSQDALNVFKLDEEYIANEEKYAALRKEILDESEGDDEDEDESGEEESDEEEAKEEDGVTIVDKTETNLLALRRTIYLTIQSSLDYEECCHKLLKMQMPEGQESELCHIILDCCAQQRTYEKFFGLLAQRFCSINIKYVAPFEEIFKATYDTVHRLDTNKLRNVAKFFAHLLFTDSISCTVMEHIKLTEDDTTSSSRIFVKILVQELSEYMGLSSLNKRFNDKTLKPYFEGLFPRDNPKNSRFSINFFTSIGLGGLTDELREFLRPHGRAIEG